MEAIYKRVLTLLIAFAALFVSAQGFTIKNPAYVASLKASAAAADGPNVWYDVETSANTDSQAAFNTANYIAATVTVSVPGTATKIRLKVTNGTAGTHNLKVGLYNNSGALLSCGSTTVLSTDDNTYVEATLDTPTAVSATTYILSAMADDIGIDYHYKAGVGAMDDWESKMFSSFCYDPIGTPDFNDLARNLAISVYVD